MSGKGHKMGDLTEGCEGLGMDPHYIGYFRCFNREMFFEAHEVLEHIWLPLRKSPQDAFYKGLIQLAGAFVHLQKERLRPAGALFRLAHANLGLYPARHEGLHVPEVLSMIERWLARLEECAPSNNPLRRHSAPKLRLTQADQSTEIPIPE